MLLTLSLPHPVRNNTNATSTSSLSSPYLSNSTSLMLASFKNCFPVGLTMIRTSFLFFFLFHSFVRFFLTYLYRPTLPTAETNGDIDLVGTRISDGYAEQWDSVSRKKDDHHHIERS
jgi:hypothetical protein